MRRFAILAAFAGAIAQTPPPTTFEAATIKPRPSPNGRTHFTVLPNRLDVLNLSLGYLIQQAFDLPAFRVSAPDAVVMRRYDVMAISDAPVSKGDMRVMLRNLLTERFHLATHWEERTESIYHLIVPPNGPKMKLLDAGFVGPNSPMPRRQYDALLGADVDAATGGEPDEVG